jgi:4-amino-4-deoxy-L-arabinose transferase-like glycosyltransferase
MSRDLAIFALALGVRLAWILTLDGRLVWADEHEFVAIGRRLADGHGYVSTTYRANPILPFFLSLVFRLGGESYLLGRIAQSLIGALTCVVVARTGRILLGPTVGALSGLVLAVYPPHVYMSGVFYAECVFTFLCALAILLAVRSVHPPHVGWAVACGVVLGLAALTRTIVLAYVPLLCAAILYAGWPRWRRQLPVLAALVLATAAAILPWTARNHATYGRLLLVSSGFGTKLWQGNNALASGGPDDRELYWKTPEWRTRMRGIEGTERRRLRTQYAAVARQVRERELQLGDRYLATDDVLGPVARRYMLEHPGRTAILFARKVGTLFSPFSKTLTHNDHVTPHNRLIAAAALYPILALALVGAWFGLAERRLAIVYAFIVALTLAYGVLNSCTRFRLPMDPYLIMLAALGASRLLGRVPDRSTAGVASERRAACAGG